MKWASRKLFVMFVATVLLWYNKLSDYVWLFVAVAYIGGNLIDKLIAIKKGYTTTEAVGTDVPHDADAETEKDDDIPEMGFKR